MAIESRNLPVGTKLVARYKKEVHTCVVEQGEDGAVAYVLADGRRFKSPSAAGSAVMGGNACNGWRFWSLAQEGEPAVDNGPEPEKVAKPKGFKLIKRTPNQKGVPEGQVRYFCSACMKGFVAPAGEELTVCPEGHGVQDAELLAVVGA